MERKLVSIQRIESVRPIEGADKIEVVRVLGWDVVVSKDTFLPNDLAIFYEIDSFLPLDDPRYNFLAKNAIKWNGLQGIRLRTVKLRKQVSQGLVLPLLDFPELPTEFARKLINDSITWSIEQRPHEEWPYPQFTLELVQDLKCIAGLDLEEELARILTESLYTWSSSTSEDHTLIRESLIGLDLTEFLNIKKWEAPIPAQLAGSVRGNFPTHLVPKTDQERVQNIFKIVKNNSHLYEVTTKLDGSSMTAYMLEDDILNICSRNWDLAETEENAFWCCANATGLRDKMVALKHNLGTSRVAVQGELIGPGVQGNFEALDALGFYVFDIYDIEKAAYVEAGTRRLASKLVGLDHVPVVHTAASFDFETVDLAVDSADGWSLNPKVRREGVVYKSLDDPAFSFKIVSARYLLEHD